MVSVSITITGVDTISSRLKNIAQSVKDFASQEPEKIANEMVEKMQAIAPVDTGYLRDHIQVSDTTENSATVISEADYSIYVEFGTRFMAAQPFFFPVVDEYTSQNIIDDFNSSVDLSI